MMLHPKVVLLTTDWVWKNPIYGIIIRFAEFYPISDGYDKNLGRLQKLVERGYSVVVFPEGTRSVTGEILRFHKGAFQLAQALNIDILPVFIHGASHVMPKNDFVLREGQLYVEIEKRMPAEEVKSMETRALALQVHRYYVEHFKEIRRQRENTEYVLPFVRYKYIYKGHETERECRRNLRRIRARAAEIDAMDCKSIVLNDSGFGELAWTIALVHPETQVYAVETDEDKYLIASHCSYIPDNLHFLNELKTCVVIGGGIGGLVTGALLAKEGYQVTVLEKNAIIGGGLQTFMRHGADFPTGMHVFGGFNEGGNLRKLFSYLGVMDKIKLQPMEEDASDVVTLMDDQLKFRLPKGKEQYIAYLSKQFPAEQGHVEAYVNKLFELTEEEDLFHLREAANNGLTHSDDFLDSVDHLRDRYIVDPTLKTLLGYLNGLMGGTGEMTPAYIHALLSTLHVSGTYQFVGGSQQLADALAKVIEDAGGRVIANEEVVKVNVVDHRVTGVVTKRGNKYQANCYVSDVHPDRLLQVMDPQAFSTAFKKRVQSIPETPSSFKVFIKFKERAFPYLNHACFCLSDAAVWPKRLMYVTPPVEHQGDFATTMVVVSEMDFDQVKAWEDTCTGHRGEAYEQWKHSMTNKVLDVIERQHPGLRDGIEFVFASSPLTIRDYYGNKNGSNFEMHQRE